VRILVVVPSLIRAGAETQAVDLANGLSSRGHAVHMCTFDRPLDQRQRLSDDVRFHHFVRQAKYDRNLIASLARIIDEERIEAVQGVLQFAAFMAWRATEQCRHRVPLVAAIHTTINRGLKEELQDRLVYRPMLRRLAAVVFVCEHQKRHWITKYPELGSLAKVVHNGVDPTRFRRAQFLDQGRALRSDLGIPATAFLFTCIAAFRAEKAHHLLIRAFSQMPPNVYLALAGDGERRSMIEAVVRSRRLDDRVRFLGNVGDIRPVIATSDATVLASTAVETFSMAMLESMAMGVPMIAPDIGGLAEAIVHRETGLLFPVGDANELASCMRMFADRSLDVVAIGEAAGRKVLQCFTLNQMVSANERILQNACESMRAAANA
jgi:glycosyltransferase involved in cell wall biosynthesis